MKKGYKLTIFAIILIILTITGGICLWKSLTTKKIPYDGIAGNVSININGKEIKSDAICVKCLNNKENSKGFVYTNMHFYVNKCEKGPYDFEVIVPGNKLKINKYRNETFIHKVGCFVLSGEKCKLGVNINYFEKNDRWYATIKAEVTDYNINPGQYKNENTFLLDNGNETKEVYIGP